ncbi:MAG: hypothetical protein KGI80_04590 [Verrucomicrobiota bacterium]|nr:hypothetical protein [Verrucomicrobiota bacterium]
MKDLPHHIKKLNRNVLRSVRREDKAEEVFETAARPPSREAKRKHKKQEIRAERLAHVPIHPSEEERNRQMRHRVPMIERTNDAIPKHTRPSRKKVPPIKIK